MFVRKNSPRSSISANTPRLSVLRIVSSDYSCVPGNLSIFITRRRIALSPTCATFCISLCASNSPDDHKMRRIYLIQMIRDKTGVSFLRILPRTYNRPEMYESRPTCTLKTKYVLELENEIRPLTLSRGLFSYASLTFTAKYGCDPHSMFTLNAISNDKRENARIGPNPRLR